MLQLCVVELEANGSYSTGIPFVGVPETVKLQEARAAMRAERSARAHAESQALETAVVLTSVCIITTVVG